MGKRPYESANYNRMKILGKKYTLEYLTKAVRNDTLNHFYIIEGADGVGKKTLAKFVSQMIHCTGPARPCGVCAHCVKHLGGNHPDFKEVFEDSDKQILSVDTVRRVSEDIYIKPLLSEKKIYLFDDEKPLGDGAQNALLKILEEPPEYAVIFLCVKSAESLLKTVLSRAVLLRADPCTAEEIAEFIKENFPNCENRGLAARLSGGIIGRAKAMAEDTEYFALRQKLYDVLGTNGGAKRALEFESFVIKNKDSLDTVLELYLSWLRDAFYLKSGGLDPMNSDYKDKISEFARLSGKDAIIKMIDTALDMSRNFTKGCNIRLWAANLSAALD